VYVNSRKSLTVEIKGVITFEILKQTMFSFEGKYAYFPSRFDEIKV